MVCSTGFACLDDDDLLTPRRPGVATGARRQMA
jgi:hypothetical protein